MARFVRSLVHSLDLGTEDGMTELLKYINVIQQKIQVVRIADDVLWSVLLSEKFKESPEIKLEVLKRVVDTVDESRERSHLVHLILTE